MFKQKRSKRKNKTLSSDNKECFGNNFPKVTKETFDVGFKLNKFIPNDLRFMLVRLKSKFLCNFQFKQLTKRFFL